VIRDHLAGSSVAVMTPIIASDVTIVMCRLGYEIVDRVTE